MASYLGWLCRTTPDYAGLLPDYFEPRRNTSGLLRSARPDTGVLGQPGPRGKPPTRLPVSPVPVSLHLWLPDKGGIPLYTMEGAPPYTSR